APVSLNNTASIRHPERSASSTSLTPSTPTNPDSVGIPPRSAMRNCFSHRLSRLVSNADDVLPGTIALSQHAECAPYATHLVALPALLEVFSSPESVASFPSKTNFSNHQRTPGYVLPRIPNSK